MKFGEKMENIKADISVNFSNSKDAQSVFSALQPETRISFTDRSKIRIEKQNNTIRFEIDAKDITAFRATINSYLLWMRMLTSVPSLIENRE